MFRPAQNRWGSPPVPPGQFQRFPRGPEGSGPRFSGPPFPQQGPRGENRMPFNKDRPLLRPSQFSGPPNGPRPVGQLNFRSPVGNGNPFSPGPRFGNFSPNGPPGMMRGPRPDFNFQNRPRFPPKPFQKNKQKPANKAQQKQEKGEVKYFCDTCDRGYKDQDKYKEHVDGHEKCRFEGCSYIAAPKLVQLHINTQHRTGLASRIWSLESAEDIKKWREERKKHYPTPENVAKKKTDQARREERGEVIQEKYFGKMHGRGRGRNRDRGRGRGGRFDRRRRGDDTEVGGTGPKQRKMEETRTDLREANQEVEKNDPLMSILSENISDDEDADEGTSSSASKLSAAGGLGALMSSYRADSSEEEGEIVEKTSDSTVVENRLEANQTGNRSQESQAGNHKDALETNENEDEVKEGNQKGHGRHRHKKRGRKNQQKQKWEPPPHRLDKSLLEKLLAKDICKERNKILQCVHYIVKKDFFGIGKTSRDLTSSESAVK